MPVSIKVKPDMRQIRAKFRHMTDEMNKPQAAMKVIGFRGFKDITEHFNKSEGLTGEWDELKRPRKRGGSKPLMDTGRLRMTFSFRYMRRAVELIKDVSYAKYHEYGTKHIPKREFMWVSAAARKSMLKLLMSSIMRSYK